MGTSVLEERKGLPINQSLFPVLCCPLLADGIVVSAFPIPTSRHCWGVRILATTCWVSLGAKV